MAVSDISAVKFKSQVLFYEFRCGVFFQIDVWSSYSLVSFNCIVWNAGFSVIMCLGSWTVYLFDLISNTTLEAVLVWFTVLHNRSIFMLHKNTTTTVF